VDVPAATDDNRWGWVELFIGIQLLWGALLFMPGMQPFRVYIRALPYVASLAALVYYGFQASGGRLSASGRWLVAAFALLALNLLHGSTHLMAGLAQVVFQVTIAAPMFWMAPSVRSETKLHRLVVVMFAASFASAAVGVLQAYYPDQFLPPEFSALARSLNPDYVDALTYVGADGRVIVRPSGLSDLPGGAAISGLVTVILGVALTAYGQPSRVHRGMYLGAAVVGMTALYLTQVRSLTIMAPVAVLVFAVLRLRQGRWTEGGAIAIGGGVMVIGSFIWAVALGGASLSERFSSLFETGFFTTFQENRGLFLEYTLTELLYQFPLGAGLGRWGMMQVYFGDPAMWQSPAIHVEIQITGWLLDGGVPMWICYGGALLAAVLFAYRTAIGGQTEGLRYFASVVLAMQAVVLGLCLTGPVFNTQLGIQFWAMTAALLGVVSAGQSWQADDADYDADESGDAADDRASSERA
jgi:hypothetical protein